MSKSAMPAIWEHGNVVRPIARRRKPKETHLYSKGFKKPTNSEHSESVRMAMRESYPRTMKQRLREAAKSEVEGKIVIPPPPPQNVLRALMRSGHMDQMGTRALMKPFKVRRHVTFPAFLAGGPTGDGAAYQMELDNFSGYTDFTTLFDQYRFTKVHYALFPRMNVHSLTTNAVTTTALVPHVWVCSDPDDSTTPTEANMLEHQETTFHSGFGVVKGSYKPYAAVAAFGGAFTSYAEFDGWCDCASDDIEWYALKAWTTVDGASQTTHQVWDLIISVDCEFRFVH